MTTNINPTTSLIGVDVRSISKTVTLPTAASVNGRAITIKDTYGSCFNNNITITTLGGDTIDSISPPYTMSNSYAAVTLVSDGVSRWMTLNSPSQPFTGSTITLSSATVSVSTLMLLDPQNGSFSNFNISAGYMLIGGNIYGAGQTPFISTRTMNFYTGYGSNYFGSNITINYLNAISSYTSNAYADSVIASTFYIGNNIVGNGAMLSNLIFPSSVILNTQFSYFTVSANTTYTNSNAQPAKLSTLNSFGDSFVLQSDGITLVPSNPSTLVYRVSYMCGYNNVTAHLNPGWYMVISNSDTHTQMTYPFQDVNSGDGDSAGFSFLEAMNCNHSIKMYLKSSRSYTFSNSDMSLYRVNFETVLGSGASILSTANVWSGYNRFTNLTDFSADLFIHSTVNISTLIASNALFYDTFNVQNIAYSYSTFSAYISTPFLQVGSAVGDIRLSNNTVYTSNIQVSTLQIMDMTTTTYKTFMVSSGSIYVGGLLAGASGSGGGAGGSGGGAGGSTISSLFVGSQCNANFIKFWGNIGEYNNAVVAEQTTGGGTGELLFLKTSTVSDQIRMQTTGAIRFETGVPSPLNYTNSVQCATPTMYIDVNSNVGIGGNSATAYKLDVFGSARFQTLASTPSLFAGSLNLGVFFA